MSQATHYFAEVEGLPRQVAQRFSNAAEVVSAAGVEHAMDQTAVRITVAMQDLNPVLITVLQGGLYCAGMLMQRLVFPLQQGYVHVGRYGDDTAGGGLTWHAQGCPQLRGRHVLLVDDILDKGDTLRALLDWAAAEGAASVRSCVLVTKQLTQPVSRPHVDFSAVDASDQFLVGCGLDYMGYGRNLPGLYALAEETVQQ